LEKRAEQVLSGSEVDEGRRKKGGLGVEMAPTMYAHMNK
jgi:hypothetical protein